MSRQYANSAEVQINPLVFGKNDIVTEMQLSKSDVGMAERGGEQKQR